MAANPREARAGAAERFEPSPVRVLLIAEAPPGAKDRYFYFPSVSSHDSLFRYVARLMLGEEPTRRNKSELLGRLKELGVFLIDVCLDPIYDKRELKACLPSLLDRVAVHRPEHVILIKRTVWDVAYRLLRDAGYSVNEEVVPFPGSGQQLRFEWSMAEVLRGIGWVPGEGLA